MTTNTNTPTPTVHKLDYFPSLKAANLVAGLGERLGLPLGSLDHDSVLRAAKRQTGLTDWGDDRFLVPLKLVSEAAAPMPFTPLARILLRQSWIRAVSNRLQLQDWLKKHPEVREHPVKRPIFVLGFPRTGTTLLQNLLAQLDGRRGLSIWELTMPVPVCEDLEQDVRRRRRTMGHMLRAAYFAAPEMAAVHYIDLDTIEECWPLFGNGFAVMNWELQSGLERYGDWLLAEWDMRHSYKEYRTYLQTLVHRLPADQLVLKCPEHLWFIDALLEVFPDACIVWTHRDPYDTVASYCSLISLQWRMLYGKIDRERVGEVMQRRLLGGIERAMAARAKADPARFFDVRFNDLVRDPADVVRRLVAHFDLPKADGTDALVASYLSKERQDDRGKHIYDGRLYGLDRAELHERYRAYIDQFGIELKTTP